MTEQGFPEECDLVSVKIKGVEYYGYVEYVDFDLRCPTVGIEFFPGCRREFGFEEIKFVKFPEVRNVRT